MTKFHLHEICNVLFILKSVALKTEVARDDDLELPVQTWQNSNKIVEIINCTI